MGSSPALEHWMASITNLIRGTDGAYFGLFERAGANMERAGALLDEMLAGFPDSQGLAEDIREKAAMYRAGLPINSPASDDATSYYSNFEEEFRNFLHRIRRAMRQQQHRGFASL